MLNSMCLSIKNHFGAFLLFPFLLVFLWRLALHNRYFWIFDCTWIGSSILLLIYATHRKCRTLIQFSPASNQRYWIENVLHLRNGRLLHLHLTNKPYLSSLLAALPSSKSSTEEVFAFLFYIQLNKILIVCSCAWNVCVSIRCQSLHIKSELP